MVMRRESAEESGDENAATLELRITGRKSKAENEG
jgi:hypothetical protein